MRFLLVIPVFLFFVPFSFSQSADVAGTWAWSGNGCRDDRLSADSHISKPASAGDIRVSSSVLVLREDGSAQMVSVLDGEVSDNRGDYRISNNRVSLLDNGEEVFVLYFIGDRLVFKDEESTNLCNRDEFFVRVFGRVD